MNRIRSAPTLTLPVANVDIPEACLPELATQRDLGRYLAGMANAFADAGPGSLPLTLFFNVVGEGKPTLRNRLFIVTLDEAVCNAVVRDLDTVKSRDLTTGGFKHLKLDLDPDTTFGSLFDQLAAVPVSLFGLAHPHPVSGEFLFAHFFVQGANLISDLKKEMHWAHIIDVDAKPAQDAANN